MADPRVTGSTARKILEGFSNPPLGEELADYETSGKKPPASLKRPKIDYPEGAPTITESGAVQGVKQQRLQELADKINDIVTDVKKEDKGNVYNAGPSIVSTETLDAQILKVSDKDVEIMLDDWIDAVIRNETSGMNPRDEIFSEHREIILDHFLFGGPIDDTGKPTAIPFNPEAYNKTFFKGVSYTGRITPEYDGVAIDEETQLPKAQQIIDRFLNTANAVAQTESELTTGEYIEPKVGAFITEDRRKGKFVSDYALYTNNIGLITEFRDNIKLQGQVNRAWTEISNEIRMEEIGKARPRFHIGVQDYIEKIIDNTDGAGWAATIFTNNPKTKSRWEAEQNSLGLSEDKLADLAKNPLTQFKKYLPSDATLKKQYGQWAIDAKKLYVGQFEDNLNRMDLQTGVLETQDLANRNNLLIQSTMNNKPFESFLQTEQESYQQNLLEKNYESLQSDFESFTKAKKQVNNWLGGLQVSENFKNRLSNELVLNGVNRNQVNSDQVVQDYMDENYAKRTLSDMMDNHILQNMSVNSANEPAQQAARNRQGYAYTPNGQLKPFSAFRFENGERIEEQGSELMANLDKYPELVQRTILLGLNRPQTEITSYQSIGVTPLPPQIFEGIEGQGRYFEAPPLSGGVFNFKERYLDKPNLTPRSNIPSLSGLGAQLPPPPANTSPLPPALTTPPQTYEGGF